MPPPPQPPPMPTVPPPAPSSPPANGNASNANDQPTPVNSPRRKETKEPILRYLAYYYMRSSINTYGRSF